MNGDFRTFKTYYVLHGLQASNIEEPLQIEINSQTFGLILGN